MISKIYTVFSLLLLIYMIWPAPSNISDFRPLPSSDKSTLSGDTTEIPNVAAYFSDNFREFIVPFYLKNYQQKSHFLFPPLKINHPPEYSWTAIKRHTDSTYLEELVYPLRDSLYVNGFEPFYSDGSEKFWGSTKFEIDNNAWFTKTTLKFYPSNILIRYLVWLGIVIAMMLIYKESRRLFKI